MQRPEIVATFQEMQRRLVAQMIVIDPAATVREDRWERPDPRVSDGGGGHSIAFAGGAVFEKGGVNFSDVRGTLSREMARGLTGRDEELSFSATGTSIVIPRNPMVPTVHANVRYFETDDGMSWFGGGTDLTPYYLFTEDAVSFHSGLQAICERHNKDYYPRFKKWCDEYFFLPHRGEARGVGGIFFDYLGKNPGEKALSFFPFVADVAMGFQELYLPIVERRKELPYTEAEREFQLIRRGRYVEFNLLHDRGTAFGLKSGGRTESILMSLPAEVRWEYCHEPAAGSREAELLSVLRTPREWV